MNSKTAEATVKKMIKIFSCHSIPNTLATPQSTPFPEIFSHTYLMDKERTRKIMRKKRKPMVQWINLNRYNSQTQLFNFVV